MLTISVYTMALRYSTLTLGFSARTNHGVITPLSLRCSYALEVLVAPQVSGADN